MSLQVGSCAQPSPAWGERRGGGECTLLSRVNPRASGLSASVRCFPNLQALLKGGTDSQMPKEAQDEVTEGHAVSDRLS